MEAKALHTFLFADLVGFTAFTERVGDEEAADVAVAFQSATGCLAGHFGCEVVKSLGDAVMIHGEDAARVVGLARCIASDLAQAGWCPQLRMGVHSGTAVRRGSDWYGSTVNLAARMAEAASAGEILLSRTTRELLSGGDPMTIADRGARSLRNVSVPVGVFAVAA